MKPFVSCLRSFFILLIASLSIAAGLLMAEPAETPAPGSQREMSEADKSKFEAYKKDLLTKVANLNYQTGNINIGNGLATLNLTGSELRYLDPKDSSFVLHSVWGNPPDSGVLGMLVPSTSLLDPDGWAVVIEYDESGYVADSEAATLDYAKILQEMQKATQEANPDRIKAGYESLTLVGWAETPQYDKSTHKMFWAKELEFGGQPEHSLNYNIRLLGRKGVLILNAVAGIQTLGKVKQATPDILSRVNFNPTNRYEDFNASTDKVAAYGLAALIAGGVAMKAGLFKGLLVMLLAFKKVIIVGILALLGTIKNLFRRKSLAKREEPPSINPPAFK